MLRAWADAFLDLLLPPSCFRCGRPLAAHAVLCSVCESAFAIVEDPVHAAALDRCIAGAAYAGEVLDWVRAFKYPPRAAFPDPAPEAMLGRLLARAARRAGALPDRIVPIPLHPRRLRRRGFNPAGLLARALARERGVAFDPLSLARTRDTPSQTGLDAAARRRNVAGAFRHAAPGRAPRRVWLVDDVVTTGATLASAAGALRRAGAREVVAVCAAATPRGRG